MGGTIGQVLQGKTYIHVTERYAFKKDCSEIALTR